MAQLIPLRFRTGFNRDTTRHGGEGSWFEGDKVRFRDGLPEVIGGWTKVSTEVFLGTCRTLFPWTRLLGEILVGVGTQWKYYVLRGGALVDVTPIRVTTAAGDVTFSATDGSTTLTITDTAHGATLNDFVTFSGAVTLGGLVTADELNQEYQVTEVLTSNTYTVELNVTANASDTGNGGASVVGEYQANVGLNDAILGLGWGSDGWGAGGWGEAGTSSAGIGNLRVWSEDNFGEDLIINARDGNIYYWDSSAGYSSSNRATTLASLAGATAAPTIAKRIMVSDADRHVIAFGCDGEFDSGTQDPLLIRWSDQEDAANWQTSTTTTAGSLQLSSGSEIITAVQTKREILIFTNSSVHSMQFLGPPYTFGIQDVARSVQIPGPEAVVSANDAVYWMSDGKFMVYDGVTRTLDCTLEDYVFTDFNHDQEQKVCAGHNAEFSEIWWFYPSADSTDNNRYVVYDYRQQVWFFGAMNRTAWHASGILDQPIAASTDGYIYQHEFGLNDGSASPAVGIAAHIESSAMDIGDGDKFFFSRRAIPDLTFRGSSGSPTALMTFKSYRFPGSNVYDADETSVMQSSTVPIEQYTEQTHIRLRGRAFALRVESNQENTTWRLGIPRIELRTDGGR